MYAYRPGALNDDSANAIIAPGPEPSNLGTPVDINAFHAAHAHADEGALRKTAKQMGVTLKEELHECKGCANSFEDTRASSQETASCFCGSRGEETRDVYGG